ncbi:dihydrofolate reductase family protein [Cryobacterium sp. N22]|uniref:dihydrofolate reductase family protein n=1 Tax=Cryobacterium sp. N22 TaxID=2048290 RepID=UPI000CE31638|nr:dihydrofolate reductase family protein [Cryobacterium sp. N22]
MTPNPESGGAAPPLIGCVFVGTSLDGFIARENGDFDWLVAAGDALGETGYDEFFASVEALVVGRATFDTVRGFVDWPYAGKRVLVLSRTLLRSFDAEAEPDTTVHATLDDVIATLVAEGRRRVYVDGGRTIQSFLRVGLIREITITRAPVLLGTGIPLFGPLDGDVRLRHVGTRELGAGFTQSSYEVLPTS